MTSPMLNRCFASSSGASFVLAALQWNLHDPLPQRFSV
jgi:hypothetical protein